MMYQTLRALCARPLLLVAMCLLARFGTTARAADPFLEGVRSTPWRTPADEQKLFTLPEGFEISLVAAEPAIQKPLNMAFDERGRIWVTNTVEYPYPVPPDQPGRDTIKILEDTDGDGRFEKVTTFVDGLNIPIGIYPWKGGCIAYSIPNIWHFEDTDGDGKCDQRTKLYGPFDYSRDTHGMVNSFRRGCDGWLYACHGFNNNSRVQGTDGHAIEMSSGNTFRFRLDGSRIEHFTHGQVNPFGMCFDERFNIFTADCHSKPISQLIRGGYYPSFGKPDGGLGFVPPMMDHLHGSTAICGLTTYTGENFPPEFRGQFFSGNVMTSRINRNQPVAHGSTIKAEAQPDFLVAGDPWFRPVDLHIGPDGAMYVLDFYNRIIGHYEVPLTHPGRDRTSGRIWRITYTGLAKGTQPARRPSDVDITKLSTAKLIEQLSSPQLEHRLRVQHWIADVVGQPAVAELTKAWNASSSPTQKTHIFWALEHLQPLDLHDAIEQFPEKPMSALRTHIVKALGNRSAWRQQGFHLELLVHDRDSFVKRAAAEACAFQPDPKTIPFSIIKKLALWDKSTNVGDDLLLYDLRLALRNHLESRVDLAPLYTDELLRGEGQRLIAPLFLSIHSPKAAEFLIHFLENEADSGERTLAYVNHAARFAPPAGVQSLVRIVQTKYASDAILQAEILLSLQNGLAQRGQAATPELFAWGEETATKLLATSAGDTIPWTPVPIDGLPPSENPWVVQERASGDGNRDAPFFSSLPRGEQRTGIYRSAPFPLPTKLSFWCAGHSGFTGGPLNDKNYIRLRDAQTGELLVQSRPTRNDTAQQIEWDLTKFVGEESPSPRPSPKGRGSKGEPAANQPKRDDAPRQGYIELVDADTADGYAWLAVGRFSLAALNPSDTTKRQTTAAEIVARLKLANLRPQMASLLSDAKADFSARAAAGNALVALDSDSRTGALVAALRGLTLPDVARQKIAAAVAAHAERELTNNLRDVMKAAPARGQTSLAEVLAGDMRGAQALVELVQAGHAAASLLVAPSVATKLAALNDAGLNRQIAELTARLPPASETLTQLIAERKASFAKAAPNLARGQEIFTKHCAACHQIAGKGNLVGPQLDGIGNRGLDRLLEDVLDPNRNVDVAFRSSTFVLADGRILSGLVRRQEGSLLVAVDGLGKEFTLAKNDIDQQQATPLSIMPGNVASTLAPEELSDLLGYLLNQRAQAGP